LGVSVVFFMFCEKENVANIMKQISSVFLLKLVIVF